MNHQQFIDLGLQAIWLYKPKRGYWEITLQSKFCHIDLLTFFKVKFERKFDVVLFFQTTLKTTLDVKFLNKSIVQMVKHKN